MMFNTPRIMHVILFREGRDNSRLYSYIYRGTATRKCKYRPIIVPQGRKSFRETGRCICTKRSVRFARHASPGRRIAGFARRPNARDDAFVLEPIVIGDVRITVPGIPICSTSEAPRAPRLRVRGCSPVCLPACLPPLFVLLVDLHAYEETTLVNNSARVTLSDERA